MLLEKTYIPQFREADATGKINIKGYLNYFQDIATQYMYNLEKGNDVIPHQYGVVWLYSKYKMRIYQEADFFVPLKLETWTESAKQSVRLYQDLLITVGDTLYAEGRLECCLFNQEGKRLCRMDAIAFPMEKTLERELPSLAGFTRFKPNQEEMVYSYTHTVRYTDLDTSMHMNNLLYINVLLNAFQRTFYEQYRVVAVEIHYISQCFEGEAIKVYKGETPTGYSLIGVKEDGVLAVQALIEVEER